MPQRQGAGNRQTADRTIYRPFHHGSIRQGADVLASARCFESVEALKEHLQSNLPQNSSDSRSRYAQYTASRFFADGKTDKPLTRFAERFRGSRSLELVTFYAMCKAELMVRDIVSDVLFPCLDAGYATKQMVHGFMDEALQHSPSVPGQVGQVLQVLRVFNLARVTSDHSTISVWPQPADLPAFLYILHDLFPEPGMYSVCGLVGDPGVRCLMWRPETVRAMLRDAARAGFVAKLSSIDDHEHVTTLFSMDDAIARLQP